MEKSHDVDNNSYTSDLLNEVNFFVNYKSQRTTSII